MIGRGAVRTIWLGLLALSVAGCVNPPASRPGAGLLRQSGWQVRFLDAGGFRLLTAAPPDTRGGLLTVYIEGDGYAWRSRTEVSDDPTPQEPVALRLALAQPQGARAYLARPCQYRALDAPAAVAARSCTSNLWAQSRFSPAVIGAYQDAFDRLKASARARRLRLVGFSGGGSIAALVAARRTDVAALVTVAAVLDTDAWTRAHAVSRLSDSLNPADDAQRLGHVPQLHLFGGRDTNVSAAMAARFLRSLPPGTPVAVRTVPGQRHTCCWETLWPRLLPPE